tara:strand:+ start:15309 stop:16067 length:759 start_codon:yes stop_codon:yes gene_type:complete
MLRTRIIPALLLHDKSLVKTQKFGKFCYIGDPANTVRIFNELEVDELCFLDISAARKNRGPNFDVLRDVASECFMPLSYGGGISSFEQAKQVYDIGFEKVIVNTASYSKPELIPEISRVYGSQAVVVSIDVGRALWGKSQLRSQSGKTRHAASAVDWARQMENRGAGELLLTSIPREGSYEGFDLELISEVSAAVDIPVIAHGGAGKLDDIRSAIDHGASAVALGSMVVFQKKDMGVLVNFPAPDVLEDLLA